MGTKYSSITTSGYNATPPSDDGTISEANKLKWATIKNKLNDPVKTALDSINSALVTHFTTGPVDQSSNVTLGASDYGKTYQLSGGSTTVQLSDAATLGAGWFVNYNVTGSTAITLTLVTGTDTFDGGSAGVGATLAIQDKGKIEVNAAGDGFLHFRIPALPLTTANGGTGSATGLLASNNTWTGTETFQGTVTMTAKAINEAKGANVASATTCDIWAPADGNSIHVTGSTGPITSFGTAPQAGAVRWITFDSTPTVTHDGSAINILNGGSSVTVAAGDMFRVYADTTTQFDIIHFKASGLASAGITLVTQEITSSGTFTVPTPATQVYYGIIGGGGGGGTTNAAGSAGGGGGGGALAVGALPPLPAGASVTVTIGAAGAGRGLATSTTGGTGGTSTLTDSYGALLATAAGGVGGTNPNPTHGTGGAGGSTKEPSGYNGNAGENGEARGNDIGGYGGDSILNRVKPNAATTGGLGGQVNNDSGLAAASTTYGAGGGGGVGNGASGAGIKGAAYFWWWV